MVVIRMEGILPTCACLAFGSLFLAILFTALLSLPPEDQVSPAIDAKRYTPVVLVTLGWCALYYCFLQGQSAAAFWVHKARREAASKKDDPPALRPQKSLDFATVKYGKDVTSAGLIFTMDRSVGNMLEQSVPFLLAIWLHALAKSPTTAAWYGWLWLLLRALYPLAFSHPSWSPKLWGAQRRLGVSWVSFVTWPSYAIVWVLLIGAAQVI